MDSYGHRSGCHAAHSCPSDTGSYECGDTGNYSQCPGNQPEDDEEKYEKKELNTTPKSNSESDLTLPSETFSEGIEISGPVTDIVDGDTLDINDIRIRLALVNTPEVGEAGFVPAKEFVEGLCLDKNGQVDIDDGQRQGSFGREIGVVYCDGINLNSELMKKGYALISAEFCEVSEFSAEPWAKSSCQMGSDENNNLANNSNQDSDSLSQKQEQQTTQTTFDFSESNEAQSYSNSKLGISLKHPTDWNVGSLKNGIQLIKEENSIYVEARKHDLDSIDVPLKQYVGDYIKERSSIREDFKLLNITETTISENIPAYKAIYTFLKTENQKDFTGEGTTNKILRLWTFAQDNAYLFAYVADEDNYDSYLPIAEKIIASIEFIPIQSNDNSEEDEGDSSDTDKKDNNSDPKDNEDGDDSNDGDDGGDKDCSDFDDKNFKVQPGDPYDLDRDGDGIACES
jgi:micrococcal nuclease